jgi:hypothetical protein
MSRRPRNHLAVLVVALAVGCAASAVRPPSPATALRVEDFLATPPPPNERYYVLLFGSQAFPKRPKYTHSWGTVVKATCAPGQAEPELEVHTISWMPATLDIHPLRFRVEPGVNLTLDFTLQEMLYNNNERVSVWGPYEIWHGMYHRFVTQRSFLESGQIGYQCIDTVGEAARCGNGSDCIHAMTDIDPFFDRQEYPLSRFGESATRHVVSQIMTRPIVINPPCTHDWLICRLGLDKYPIVRRTYRGRVVPFSPEAAQEYAANAESTSRRRR